MRIPGVVTFDDPPMITSGMVDIWMDDEGRLGWFQAIPDEKRRPRPLRPESLHCERDQRNQKAGLGSAVCGG